MNETTPLPGPDQGAAERHRLIVFDFDGTLHDRIGDERAANCDPWPSGKPVAGAVEFVRDLVEAGYDVAVISAQFSEDFSIDYRFVNQCRAWLERNGFPPLRLLTYKPPALAYVDDRGWRFNGDWQALRAALTLDPRLKTWQGR